MGSYGIFESIEGSEGERKIASRDTQRKLDAAIDDVRNQYGAFLFGSRDGEEWNDRVALCKNDMIRTVDAHLMPVTGVMRRIVKACKDEWRQRTAWDQDGINDWAERHAPGSTGGGKHRAGGEDKKPVRDVQNASGLPRNPFPKTHKADKTGPELKPEGDWEAYLKSVGQSDSVDNCFKEGYRYAENGIGAAPDAPDAGTGMPTGDPISQAAATPIGIPGIQANIKQAGGWDDFWSNPFEDLTKDDPAGKEYGFTPTRPGDSIFQPGDTDAGASGLGNSAGLGLEGTPSGGSNDALWGWSQGGGQGGNGDGAANATVVNQTTPGNGGAGNGNGGGATGGGGGDAGGNGGGDGGGGSGWQENNLTDAINTQKYTAQEGDTLSDIAQRSGWGENYKGLADAAGIDNPDVINVGQEYDLGKPKGVDGGNDARDLSSAGGKWGAPAAQSADAAKSALDSFGAAPAAAPAAEPTAAPAAEPAPAPAAPAPDAAPTPTPAPAPTPTQIQSSLALAQYIDWCDSFGMRRASVDALDKYAANLNDQAYFEIASALTDPGSPIYRMAETGGGNPSPGGSSGVGSAPGAGGYGAQYTPPSNFGGGGDGYTPPASFATAGDGWTPPSDSSYSGGDVKGGEYLGVPGTPGFKGASRFRTAAPDYLQKADEALTNLLNQKAEEFQETIQPLQQALQTVQQAEQAQAAMNPMGVQPPAGTVNVLPGQGDPAAGGMPPGGGDPSQGGGDPMAGLDPAMLQQLLGGGGDPSGGQGGPPPGDPSQQMMARRRVVNRGKGRGASSPKVADVVTDYNKGWGSDKVPGLPTGNPEVDLNKYETQTGKPLGPKQRNKLVKPVSTANPMPKSKRPITTPIAKQANFFTRKVAGWTFDDHLNGYLASKPTPFTCKCGAKHPVPSYSTCKCGKIWNSYVIGTGGDNHQASVEKFICREIPVRDNVIVARRKRQAMSDLGLNVTDSAPHPDKPLMLVYGGAFNPPHQGHVGALQDAHDTLAGAGYNVAGTIVAPTADKLLAHKEMAPEHRLGLQSRANVVRSAFPKDMNGAPVMVHTGPSEEVEQGLGKPRRTDLARWAQQHYPDHTIVNVTGEDAVVPGAPDIHPSIYSGAPGSNHEGFAYLTMPRDPDESMSSSKIRAALAAGQPLPGMTPESENAYREELAKLGGSIVAKRRKQAGGWQELLKRRGGGIVKYTEDEEEEPVRVGGKVKRHNLSDPGPLGNGKDDKMPDINDDLGQDWYKRGPGGKYARNNRRSR